MCSHIECSHNRDMPSEFDRGGRWGDRFAEKAAVLGDYGFNFAFENSKFPGYVSEKVYEALAAGTVPVYIGEKACWLFITG